MGEEKVINQSTGPGEGQDEIAEICPVSTELASAPNADVASESEFVRAVRAVVDEAVRGFQGQIDLLKAAKSVVPGGEDVGSAKSVVPGGEDVSSAKSVVSGAIIGENGREAPDRRVDFSRLSYSELCAFLESHPKTKFFN